ncbi:MAG: AAA family ATPase [Proteobacteria bacterium]|nr:AAA family ATPase [Pseudomonadota bacterium]
MQIARLYHQIRRRVLAIAARYAGGENPSLYMIRRVMVGMKKRGGSLLVEWWRNVMHASNQLIPFGEISESFTGLRDKRIYYVDKTGFIPFMIEQNREICVVTRPRRFGKTLMLRTLQTFFEYRLDGEGKPIDNRRYFDGLKVMDAGEDVLKHLGQYPVIYISLKDVSGDTYDSLIAMMRKAIYDACQPYLQLLLDNPVLLEEERAQFRQYATNMASDDILKRFLGDMCVWLNRITTRNVVILLDEYDVPLQQSAIYDNHHPGTDLFKKTARLIGQFISSGFKTNSNLAYGVISGCMRVAKESIFTGMNNPGVIDVLNKLPDEYWGFTEDEVKQMLAYYDLNEKYSAIEQWYDGYNFGGRKVFNPWSLLNAIRGLVNGYDADAIQPYWVMTSGNDIIEDVIERNPQHRELLAKMMNGETIRAQIYKNLSYRDLKQNPDAIWSFLLYTGYLKAIKVYRNEDDLLEAEVTVPNTEIKTVMRSSLQHWWKNIHLASYDAHKLFHALMTGDIATAERELRIVLNDSTSVFDYNEAFYHGMLFGLLGNVAVVRSNDEYGEGRPDIVALAEDMGVILEVKCVTPKTLDKAKKSQPNKDEDDIVDDLCDKQLDDAQQQIIDRKYMRSVLRNEPLARDVVAYAVCFCRKWCVVRKVG